MNPKIRKRIRKAVQQSKKPTLEEAREQVSRFLKIRYATAEESKAAGKWVLDNYSEVLRRLKD